jgi:hypothetical protein
MDKYEYWFLDWARRRPVGMNWLLPDQYGHLGDGRAPLDLSFLEMVEVACSVFKKSWVLAGSGVMSTRDGFCPTESQIQQGLLMEIPLHYFLTREGAAQWEKVSQPNWDNFNSIVIATGRPCHLKSRRKEFIEQYIERFSYLPLNSGLDIVRGSMSWREESPWQATYWKTLDFTYVVEFNCVEVDAHSLDTSSLFTLEAEADQWFMREISWYYDQWNNKWNSG